VSSTFPLRPNPVPRETVPSFLSRLAAMRKSTVAQFAYDMGVSLRRVLNNDDDAMTSLATWGGLSREALAELLSWTGERIGDVRMTFRSEVFVSRALRNPAVRGCPVCLREDAEDAGRPAIEAMAMRGDWLFREVSLCLRHCHPLVPLWEVQKPSERDNMAARIAEIAGAIMEGAHDRPRCEPSAHDLWLDRRLETGEDTTWLGQHPLYPSAVFCRLLGDEVMRVKGQRPDDDWHRQRAARAAGFAVAREGEGAIREALASLANATLGQSASLQKAFGQLYAKLRNDLAGDAGFDPFRRILREYILSVWPIGAGGDVLGEVVVERRLHSLHSASLETWMSPRLLEPFLIEAGALRADDNRSESLRTFNAHAHAKLLADIPILVGLRECGKAIGATRLETDALVADGVLVPRCRSNQVRRRWSLQDAKGTVAELSAIATSVNEDAVGWEGLVHARKRSGLGLAALIGFALAGVIAMGIAREGGFHGLRVSIGDVDRLCGGAAERKLLTMVPATTFGESVGIRGGGQILALISAKYLPATRMRNTKNGQEFFYLSYTDIVAFHRRFVTITTLVGETGLHRNTLRTRLAGAKVPVFSPAGEDFGFLFLRDVVEKAINLKS